MNMQARLLIIFLLVSTVGFAQQKELASPNATLHTFYDNLQEGGRGANVASKAIHSRHISSKKNRENLVSQLKSYMDKEGLVINFAGVPTSNDYLDSLSNKHYYIVTPGISLQKIGKNWYFSKATVEYIPSLTDPDAAAVEPAEVTAKKQQQARQVELARIARMPVDLSSPYATIKFFDDNIEVDPAIAARIISSQDISHLEDRIDIAEKLNRFFGGKGVWIDPDKIPDDPEYTDSTKVGRFTYELSYRFAEIYLERDGKNWYLSKESAEKVPELYKTAFPFGSDRLLKYLPTEGRKEIFGLYAWQYIAVLLIVILTYLIFRLLNWSITFLVTKILFRFGYKELAQKFVNPVVRPIGLLIAFMLAETSTPFLQLPVKITAFISVTVELLIPLFATIAVYNAMDIVGLYMKKMADKTETSYDDQIVPIVRKILKTFVVIIGGIIVLQNLNVNIGLLLGGLSVGGLALALAAQDTIKNFFGSLMIFMDKPFQAGHWITASDGIDGTVEQVGFRSTRIRTFANSVITVPNGKLSDASIDNHGLRAYRRFKTNIAVTYNTPPDVLDLFIKGLREIVKEHPNTRKDSFHIYMNDMGSHSLNILFYIFFITPSWGEELQYRHEVILSIIRLAHELGINFAFPTQTLHMENFPGQMSLSPTYEQIGKLDPKMKKYFDDQKGPNKDQTNRDKS
jgi:MscS family membrane protein